MSAALLVQLKIIDLTAWTALDAGRRLLGPSYQLTRLSKEELYLFQAQAGTSPDSFEGALANAIETSNFFVNPNKERYRFLGAANRGEILTPPAGSWGILARPRGDTRDAGLLERLLREHPLTGLGAIRRARVWWLSTRGPLGDSAVEDCYRVLGPLERSDHGLLVNPHAEASLRIEGSLPWAEIETFLADPAPALEAV